jgi:predicted transposase YdaD
MPQNDNAFKVMLKYHPEQFVQWLLPGAEYIEMLSGELPRESVYADALLRVRYQGKEYVLHIEIQTGADATIVWRLLQYLAYIGLQYKLTVLPVVIYLEPGTTAASPWHLDGPMGPIMAFHFSVIKLWEQPVEEWLRSGQTSLLIFTALLKDATLATVDVAIETIRQVADPVERTNALNYLILFAMRRFGEDVITNHIKEHPMLDEYIVQSEWYQYILRRGTEEGMKEGMKKGLDEGLKKGLDEGLKKGLDEGLKKGLDEGLKKGLNEGERRMAQRALEGRFGTVSDDILAALPQADEATLEAIVMHIATDTLEQVRARLGLANQP